jgi:hypothetical protein
MSKQQSQNSKNQCRCPSAFRPAPADGAAADGGAERDRTDDLLLAKQALSQLSYSPQRLELQPKPATAPKGWSSSPNPLQPPNRPQPKTRASRPRWWARVDSNYRPHAYQACALTRLSYGPARSAVGSDPRGALSDRTRAERRRIGPARSAVGSGRGGAPSDRTRAERRRIGPARSAVGSEERRSRRRRLFQHQTRINKDPGPILRKEVIQPQVPLRLPCYDFTPVADLTVIGCLPKVGAPA